MILLHKHPSHEHHHHEFKWFNIVLFVMAVGLYISTFFVENEIALLIISLTAVVLAGYHIIYEGLYDTIVNSIKYKRFMPNTHLLMLLAAIGAIIIAEYKDAALLIIIFSGAHYLEEYAQRLTTRSISQLMKNNPTTAIKIENDQEVVVDVKDLQVGDIVKVLNGSQIPIDGEVISGVSNVNEAAITGEALPVLKSVGDKVYATTLNGDSTLMIKTTKNSEETVFAGIIKLVSQAQNNISKTAMLIKRIEPWYVTIVLLLTPLFYVFAYFGLNLSVEEAFIKTMIFLMVTSPCALAVTDIPASLSAISNLAKRGILMKGGDALANLADIKTVCFDKTGTITKGKPKVVSVKYLNDDPQLVDILVNMESQSVHPIASAIINYFPQPKEIVLNVKNIIGVGLSAEYQNDTYIVAKPAYFNSLIPSINQITQQLQSEGNTVFYFAKNDEVVMVIAVCDVVKPQVLSVIKYFNQQNVKTALLSGDAQETVAGIGKQLGIDYIQGGLLPEHKHELILDYKKEGLVCMLGDGVNDAPALVSADVGIAMGEGTDVAIEVSDGIIMKNDIYRLMYAHKLAKRLKRVIWQNIFLAMGTVLFLIIMNILGRLNMGIAVAVHEGSTLIVILSSLRLLIPLKERKEKTDGL